MGQQKPLHLIIVDAWHPGVVQRELHAGRLPALAHLLRKGRLDLGCSIFPTVTPACLTSIVTGVAPDRHGVAGVLWYHDQADRYVHYWPYPQCFWWGTLDHVLADFFLHLNGEHLSRDVKTVFELLEEAGVPSASVNFPVCRGPYLHGARLPWLLSKLGKLPRDLAIPGPRHIRHGDLIRGGHGRGHLLRRYGFSDRQGARFTAELVRTERPAFTLTYFNENDLRSHQLGPENTGSSLRAIDRELGRIMDAYGSWEQAATEARWILTGDHAQSRTYPRRPGFAVNVYKALAHLDAAPMRTGGFRRNGHDFAVAPNDRMCFFYLPEGAVAVRETLLAELASWPAVDQLLWREDGWYFAYRHETGELMRFRPGGPVSDPNGARWTVRGAPGALGARLVGERLRYGDYPNALERVCQAVSERPGGPSLVATARLGYEFTSGFPMGRGNHGSLHAEDSYVPLVTVGVTPPSSPRLTDIVPMILSAFDVPLPAYFSAGAPAESTAREA